MRHARISLLASADLDAVWLYIAADNERAADQFTELVLSKADALAQNPEMGRQRPELGRFMRSLAVGNYLIIYRPQRDGGVEVVRVLHAARDIESLFDD